MEVLIMKLNGAQVYLFSLFTNLLFWVTKSDITFFLGVLSSVLACVYYIIKIQKERATKTKQNVGQD